MRLLEKLIHRRQSLGLLGGAGIAAFLGCRMKGLSLSTKNFCDPPTTNVVTVSTGGMAAAVSFAGLGGPGLYQLNVAVPAGLRAGDHAVIASVGGFNTQSNALLKITL
jgi:uncharacterized protein (TIGR03437 family)